MNKKYEVDPEKDCGTKRCYYPCEKCPFGIPEQISNDSRAIRCNEEWEKEMEESQ